MKRAAERDELSSVEPAQLGRQMPVPSKAEITRWLAAYQGSRFAMSAIASELVGAGVVPATQEERPIRANVVTLLAGAFVTQVLIARLPPDARFPETTLAGNDKGRHRLKRAIAAPRPA